MEQTKSTAGNLTIEIRKSSLGQQCINSATVTLIPSGFGGRRMEVESNSSRMSLQAKFKNVPFKGKIVKDYFLHKKEIGFPETVDLARSLYNVHFNFQINTDGVSYKLKGKVEDEYDFRWGVEPKVKTPRGYTLRWVGNGAYIGQSFYVLGNFKTVVDIEAQGTL